MALPTNLQTILDKLSDNSDDLVAGIKQDVESLETKLFASLSDFISGLEKDKAGNIKPNKANIKKLSTLNSYLNNAIVDDAYLKKVNEYIKSLEESQALIAEYFKASDVGYKDDMAFNKVINDALLNPIKNTLTQEGLSQNVNTQIQKSITNSIVGGYKSTQALSELSLLVIGNKEKQGLLSRHIDQVATDATNQYVATYYEVIGSDLGLEFYLYEGSKKDTTREFCQQRYGKYFHKKEIQAWGNISSWAGRIPTTNSANIFIYRGGYNCRHQPIPVSTVIVPKDVIERNIANGNYTPKK
jgi:hypothetical protein